MGRFDFVSPGAMAGEAIQQQLMQRELLRRQMEAESLARARESRLEEQARLARETQEKQREIENVRWEYQNAPRGGAGLDPTRAARVRELGMGSLLTQGQPVQGPQIGEDESGVPEYQVTPGIVDYGDTPAMRQARETKAEAERKTLSAQQRMQNLLLDPNIRPEVKEFIQAQQASGDTSLPYQLFETKEPEQVLRVSPDRKTILERQPDGSWAPPAKISDKAHWLNEQDPSGGAGANPYWIGPVRTAEGIFMVNGRDTTDRVRIGDMPPGEAAQGRMVVAARLGNEVMKVKNEFKPEFVGPLQGRLNTIKQEYWGDDPDYARFRAQLVGIGNQLIQLRTGAAMGTDEAQRILSEVANTNLPVATFKARMDRLEELFKEYLQFESRFSYGRMTPEDITSMITGQGLPPPQGQTAPPPAATPTQPSSVPPSPPATAPATGGQGWQTFGGGRVRRKPQ